MTRPMLLLIGVLLIAGNLRASITSVGPVLSDIQATLALSGAASSILIGIPLIGFGLVSPLSPAIARLLGIERALGAAVLTLALGIVLRSSALPGGIWAGTLLLGAAIAVLNVLLPSLVKRDYPQRIGAITGIYTVTQSLVAALSAGIAVPVAVAASSWQFSLGIWAIPALVAFLVFLPHMRERNAADRPVPRPADTDARARRPLPIWRSALAWQVTLFMGLQSTVFYILITWWPTIERSAGLSSLTAGWHLGVFQAVSVFGNILAAVLLQRLRDQRLLNAGFGVLAIAAVGGLMLFPKLSLLWVVMSGISVGGPIVVALSLFGLRTSNHLEAAALSGMAQSVGYLLAAFGPFLFGLLHDLTASWRLPLILLLVVACSQLVFGVLAGRDRVVQLNPADDETAPVR